MVQKIMSSNINDISDETVKRFPLFLRSTWHKRYYPETFVISGMRLSSKSLHSIYVVHGPEDPVQYH